MARPIKKGLDYFPLDCELDDKFAELEAELGEVGCWRLIRMLQRIYRWEGYYTDWTDKQVKIFAGRNAITKDYINQLTKICLDIGFFDKEKFNKYKILTSSGIQKIYLQATKSRKSTTLIEEYLIDGISAFLNEENINFKLTRVNSNLNTQSKVNKSKVNSKENKIKINPSNNPLNKEGKDLRSQLAIDMGVDDKLYENLANRLSVTELRKAYSLTMKNIPLANQIEKKRFFIDKTDKILYGELD